MNIQVQLFSTLRSERFNTSVVQLQEGAEVSDLLDALNLSPVDISVLTVNKRDASLTQALEEGDFVTIIPPLGGG